MILRAGARLRSQVCATEVVVVRAPADEIALTCGGHPMIEVDATPSALGAPSADRAGGTLLGKRYASDASSLEVLCTKAGDGSLALGDEELPVKGTKALPASD